MSSSSNDGSKVKSYPDGSKWRVWPNGRMAQAFCGEGQCETCNMWKPDPKGNIRKCPNSGKAITDEKGNGRL